MSALATSGTPGAKPTRPTVRPLAAVARRSAPMSRLPFLLVLAGILAAGMVGILLLNTTLQAQAFEVRRLQSQATRLGYEKAALESKVEKVSTTPELARRATDLGMRPNPYPVYVVLPTGEVRGVAKPVQGDELPLVTYKAPIDIAEQRAKLFNPDPPAPAPVADPAAAQVQPADAAAAAGAPR